VHNVEKTYEPVADFASVVAHEHSISASLDGRSVFDDRKKEPRTPAHKAALDLAQLSVAREKQLSLFGADN
jgi:hypothetical protein